jgi:3-deoxy-D-manno-octulosonic-acid transferase
MFLINARMSQKSVDHWHYAKGFGVKIFENFDAIFAQSIEDQKRFADLSKKEVFFYGNLKSQARDLVFDDIEVANLKEQIGYRKFWIAASTHKGEEEIILKTHQNLKKYFPDILTILIPRHPNRAAEIKLLFGETKFAQRSKKQKLTDSTEIYLADTLGELGNFYQLADFVFLGGSLLPIGGHNPFEPIKLNCAVITGPHVFNFAEVYEHLKSQNACIFVNSADDLTKRVGDILSNPYHAKSLAEKGLNSTIQSENIAAKIINQIENFTSR